MFLEFYSIQDQKSIIFLKHEGATAHTSHTDSVTRRWRRMGMGVQARRLQVPRYDAGCLGEKKIWGEAAAR